MDYHNFRYQKRLPDAIYCAFLGSRAPPSDHEQNWKAVRVLVSLYGFVTVLWALAGARSREALGHWEVRGRNLDKLSFLVWEAWMPSSVWFSCRTYFWSGSWVSGLQEAEGKQVKVKSHCTQSSDTGTIPISFVNEGNPSKSKFPRASPARPF